jgi:hypothetical protein
VGDAGGTPAPDGTCGNIGLCLLALLCSVESDLTALGFHVDAEESVYIFLRKNSRDLLSEKLLTGAPAKPYRI